MDSGQSPLVGIHCEAACVRSGKILLFLCKADMLARKRTETQISTVGASRADEVHVRFAQLGIGERDIAGAVRWAREASETSRGGVPEVH